MDARDALTDLVKSIQKNMVNARTDESKGPSGRGRTGAVLERALACGAGALRRAGGVGGKRRTH